MSGRAQTALFALLWTALAGAIQVVATVELGLLPATKVRAAAAAPPGPYLVAAAAVTGGLVLAALLLRRRPLWAALSILAVEAAGLFPAARVMTVAGTIYSLELFAHHWAAVSAAVALVAAAGLVPPARPVWARRVGRLAAGAAVVAATVGLAAHVIGHARTFDAAAPLQAAAAGLVLAAAAGAIGVRAAAGRAFAPTLAASALLVPWLVRVAVTGRAGLAGAPAEGAARIAVTVALGLGALVLLGTVRPRLSAGLRVVVHAASALAVGALYVTYDRFFGEVEAAFDELARSFLGFSPPYPTYVPVPARIAFAVAVFAAVVAAYGALVSRDRRREGLALAVALLAGVGLSSPQTVLMAGAGLVAFAAFAIPATPASAARPPPRPAAAVFEAVARDLGWEPPVVVDDGRRTTLRAEGTLGGIDVRLSGRVRKGRVEATATVGVPPKARPVVALEPRREGEAPLLDHPIGRTHRVAGRRRALESIDDALLDALLSFPDGRVAWWPSGVVIEFGRDLARFEPPQVEALLRAAARSFA